MVDLICASRDGHRIEPPPRVSVIMPFLNAAPFIDEAIVSVLDQTLVDWELLLVDDGSTDASRDIAARHAAGDPRRIRLLSHPARENRGTAASRNLGMAEARGQYIAFLDADDVFEPRRLEHHVTLLDAEPGLGLVIGADLYWYSWASGTERAPDQPDRVIGLAAKPDRRYEPPWLLIATLLTSGSSMPAVCGLTFRRTAFVELGPIPVEFAAHYEDQVLFCKLLLEYSTWVTGPALARYRQRAGSITGGNASLCNGPHSPAMVARERFLRWLDRYLRDTGRGHRDLVAWIERELTGIQAVTQRAARGPQSRPTHKRWLVAARRALPVWLVQAGYKYLHGLTGWVARRRVMRLIQRYERECATNPGSPGARSQGAMTR